MKVIILAGGYGSRLSEETQIIPKPMVEIGGKPILWHILKIYSHYGFNDFIICLGYKGYVIKDYFINYFIYNSDFSINLNNNTVEILEKHAENWKVNLVDTGLDVMTGGRIKKIQNYINNQTFMLTYGDGLSDVNITTLLKFHRDNRKLATVTIVNHPSRYGVIKTNGSGLVKSFKEKPVEYNTWINGGFYVLEPGIFDYINDDNTVWEQEPMENLEKNKELMGYKHNGFWKAMDTLRDRIELEAIWQKGNAPWKIW